jgi:hypothetical protein
VQAKIYRELGGTRQYDKRVWQAFGDRVGWILNKSWIYYRDVTFDLKAPLGHLPIGVYGGYCFGIWKGNGFYSIWEMEVVIRNGSEVINGSELKRQWRTLFSRVETCKM